METRRAHSKDWYSLHLGVPLTQALTCAAGSAGVLSTPLQVSEIWSAISDGAGVADSV
jgi:hypothetical protein